MSEFTYKRVDEDTCLRSDGLEIRRSKLPEWMAFEEWVKGKRSAPKATHEELRTGTQPIDYDFEAARIKAMHEERAAKFRAQRTLQG